ncbi:MAG: bifunctional ornithine acetyltransferase/N-acetylglutamate synthase, partial [Bryobacteraceae bacterium]
MSLPLGFRYSATYAGIRKVAKDDLAMIVSDSPASAAAVFTKNLVVAAPVEIARRNLRAARGKVRACLINAGNANCATRTGELVAVECMRAAARALGVQPHEVLPASTGVIGVEMNARLVTDALPKLAAALHPDRFEHVAAAIMTTDTRPKTAFASMKRASVAGMTKGSGMI